MCISRHATHVVSRAVLSCCCCCCAGCSSGRYPGAATTIINLSLPDVFVFLTAGLPPPCTGLARTSKTYNNLRYTVVKYDIKFSRFSGISFSNNIRPSGPPVPGPPAQLHLVTCPLLSSRALDQRETGHRSPTLRPRTRLPGQKSTEQNS